MSYKIVTDSSADVRELSGIDFASVPLKIMTNEKEFIDNSTLDTAEMLDYLGMYRGKSHTSCPNSLEYLRVFAEAENVFVITITKNLSGSYNAARVAAEEYIRRHPERKVHVVDTLTTGPECALLIEKLRELILGGADFETVKAEITEYQKRCRLIFALESLHNLAANGRVNPLVAKISGALGIRVIGRASDEGTLEVTNKSRGMQRAVSDIVANMKNEGYVNGRVIIHEADAPEVTELLISKIRAEFGDVRIDRGVCGGLCSFYAERGGILIGFEVNT